MKKFLLACCALTLASCGGGDALVVKGSNVLPTMATALEAGTPTEMYVKVKRLWLLPEASCKPESGKTLSDYLVTNRETFEEFDLVQNPKLFTGSPIAATYNCMILEMSDTIKFKPDQVAQDAHGIECCDVSKDYYFDVFWGSDEWYNPVTNKNYTPQGIDQYATEAEYNTSYQSVYMFASTSKDDVIDAVADQILTLTQPVIITGAGSVELNFIVNTYNKITEGYSTVDTCSFEKPEISVLETI
jgi:hypothetical protein